MKQRPTDYEDEAPTRVETPLPIRHDPDELTYRIGDETAEHGKGHHDRRGPRSPRGARARRIPTGC